MTALSQISSPDVPDWLLGVWKRSYLKTSDGLEDCTSAIYWIQTRLFFVDIRIPVAAAALDRSLPLAKYGPLELKQLGEIKGFAGHTLLEGDICTWIRPIDVRPPTTRKDTGRLELRGQSLWEFAVDETYIEEYLKVASGDTRRVALISDGDHNTAQPQAVLLIVDDFVILATASRAPFPEDAHFADLLVSSQGNLDSLSAIMSCEISLARYSDMEVILSTHPWRVGRQLHEHSHFSFRDDDIMEMRSQVQRIWKMHESSCPPEAIVSALNIKAL